MDDERMPRELLTRIKRIADRRIKDGRTPSHVLDCAPRADDDWVRVYDYVGLLLDVEGRGEE